MAGENTNTNVNANGQDNVAGVAPQGAPEANGTEPEKETLKDKAKKAYNKEITFTPKKVVTTALKIIGGAAAVIGIAGYAYNKGQNEALAMQANEAYPGLPDNTGKAEGFSDAAAFETEPDTAFENEPSEVSEV